jgi:hypothetical protein
MPSAAVRRALARLAALALLAAAPLAAQHDAKRRASSPDSTRIVTEDVARFWAAYDRAGPGVDSLVLDSLYLVPGTPGLRDFVAARIGSAAKLAGTIRRHPRWYASIRASTLRIAEMEPRIRESLRAFERIYPEAVFPDIYFVVGRMTSGGTVSDRGLLIGAEMHARTPDMPEEELSEWHRQVLKPVEDVPHIVAHELVHFQQSYGDTSRSLLALSLREGIADFLGEMASGRQINEHVHAWANPREAELWREFRERLHGSDLAGWFTAGPDGRPKDLGYWIGYRIARAYYERAGDKRAAVRELLTARSFDALLAASGYGERLGG